MILKTIDKFAGFKISGSLVAVCGIGQVSATRRAKTVSLKRFYLRFFAQLEPRHALFDPPMLHFTDS